MIIAYTRTSSIYNDSRATKEITVFLEEGYRVTVFGWNRDGQAEKKCKEIYVKYGNRLTFYFFSGNEGKGYFQKYIARYKWILWLKNHLRKLNRPFIVHACDFDTGLLVYLLAKKRQFQYVYDIFDFYVDAHLVPAVVKGFLKKKEYDVISAAAATIICTEEREKQIRGSRPKRLLVIHNSPEIRDYYVAKNEIDYAYCGTLGEGRLIREILDQYKHHHDLKFVFAGNGALSRNASDVDKNEENFTFLGALTYSEVLKIEQRAVVISAIYNPENRNHRFCAPNKFYEALAYGKPLIVCKGTGIDKIVQEYKIGAVIEYDVEQFYDAVISFLQEPELCDEMGRRGRALYEEKYQWSVMRRRLIALYRDLEEREIEP